MAKILTTELLKELDDNTSDKDGKWRHQGLLFGQRRTYWDVGTLGRCDLEPTDRCVSHADRHASYYRVLETVNNIKLRGPGEKEFLPLNKAQRNDVIDVLRKQKTGTLATVQKALGIDKVKLKKLYKGNIPEGAYVLNLEQDKDREINGDWFHSSIVINGIGEKTWNGWDDAEKEKLNRTLLRFDPKEEGDEDKIKEKLKKFELEDDAIEKVIAGWKSRPKLEKRLKLSRRAVMNLVPIMEQEHPTKPYFWPTQIEARELFASKLIAPHGKSENLPKHVKYKYDRYRLGGTRLNKRDRHYQKKHGVMPPAPELSNPVVRKAIHEVRRHVIAYLKKSGGEIPDRVVIEFARETTKPKKLSDQMLILNRKREKIRKVIIDEDIGLDYHKMSNNQINAAVERVILCKQQRFMCAYSGESITPRQAAIGNGLEVDHIIPRSRCGDNSLNNRVLCYKKSNQNKRERTPNEWAQHSKEFNLESAPLRFMAEFEKDDKYPAKEDYFTKRDYIAKWKNFTRTNVAKDWKGSQLSDTAYAASEVQKYLQEALWPDENHLQTDRDNNKRRIFVTKGAYTSTLRKDWQLYKQKMPDNATSERVVTLSAKNRGDHREHAIDAVAIALTRPKLILDLSAYHKQREEVRYENKKKGLDGEEIKRKKLPTPWGNVQSFRRQVLSLIYDDFEDTLKHPETKPIVVCHRPVKRKLIASFHEESLLGPVPQDPTLFVGRKKIDGLKPNHLRMPRKETDAEAIERVTNDLLKNTDGPKKKEAKSTAQAIVKDPNFKRLNVDQPPEKSGIVRDIALRKQLRNAIEKGLQNIGSNHTADNFTDKDLKDILKDGPLRMSSGVPIKRFVLLRTMSEPVLVDRYAYDFETRKNHLDSSPKAKRAYVGGNNHHIEVRENAKGKWTGEIVPNHTASIRVRKNKLAPVDRSDDPEKGGKFIMSLAEGEIVYMRQKPKEKDGEPGQAGFYVVFKLDKPQTIQFKAHWDARRATGEKDDNNKLIDDSEREAMPVSATDFKDLAPPGYSTPVKVHVDPLGQIKVIEPYQVADQSENQIDPRVMVVARDAMSHRSKDQDGKNTRKHKKSGSWAWMKLQLERQKIENLSPQLTLAMRLLQAK